MNENQKEVHGGAADNSKRTLHFTIEGKCYAYVGSPIRREEDFFHLYVKIRQGDVHLTEALAEFMNNVPTSTLSHDDVAEMFYHQRDRFLRRNGQLAATPPRKQHNAKSQSEDRSVETEFWARADSATILSRSSRHAGSMKSALEVQVTSSDDSDSPKKVRKPPSQKMKRTSRRSIELSAEALQRHNTATRRIQHSQGLPLQREANSDGATVTSLLRDILRKQDEMQNSSMLSGETNVMGQRIHPAQAPPTTVHILANLLERDKDDMTPLHHAATSNDVAAVLKLLRAGVYIDSVRRNDGVTPLMLACETGSLLVVHALLQQGAKIDIVDYRGAGLLHYASSRNRVDVMNYLISRGCSPCTSRDLTGRSPLHYSLLPETQGPHLESVSCLLLHGVDVNCQDRIWAQTPLHYAANWGWCSAVNFLVAHGADLWIEDAYAQNAFNIAAQRRHADVIHLLSELEERRQGWSQVHLAALRGQDMINHLITIHPDQVNSRDSQQRTELHLCCMADHTAICDLLLAKGADITATDAQGNTILHDAAARGQESFVRTILRYDLTCLEKENKEGNSPYFLAFYHAQFETCALLRDVGCDIVFSPEQVYRLDRRRRRLCSKSAVCGYALRKDLNVRTLQDASQMDTDMIDELGRRPIHCSAFVGDIDAVRLLLIAQPGDVHTRDYDGCTVMHWACRADVSPGTLSPHKATHIADVIQLLLDADRSLLYIRNTKGERPIDIARHEGLSTVVSLLSTVGAPTYDIWHWVTQKVIVLVLLVIYMAVLWPVLVGMGYLLRYPMSTSALRSTTVIFSPVNQSRKNLCRTVGVLVVAFVGVLVLLAGMATVPATLIMREPSSVDIHTYVLSTYHGALLPPYMVPLSMQSNETCSRYVSSFGEDYMGNVSWTASRLKCKEWSNGAHSFCRNPNKRRAPWCYTQSPYILWDFCAVEPPCTSPPQIHDPVLPGPTPFIGKKNVTLGPTPSPTTPLPQPPTPTQNESTAVGKTNFTLEDHPQQPSPTPYLPPLPSLRLRQMKRLQWKNLTLDPIPTPRIQQPINSTQNETTAVNNITLSEKNLTFDPRIQQPTTPTPPSPAPPGPSPPTPTPCPWGPPWCPPTPAPPTQNETTAVKNLTLGERNLTLDPPPTPRIQQPINSTQNETTAVKNLTLDPTPTEKLKPGDNMGEPRPGDTFASPTPRGSPTPPPSPGPTPTSVVNMRLDKSPLEENTGQDFTVRMHYITVVILFGLLLGLLLVINLHKVNEDPTCSGTSPTYRNNHTLSAENSLVALDAILFSLGLSSLAVCTNSHITKSFGLYKILSIFTLQISSEASLGITCTLLAIWFLVAGYIALSNTVLMHPKIRSYLPIIQPTYMHDIPLPILYLFPRSLTIPIYSVLFRMVRCDFVQSNVALWAYDTTVLCFLDTQHKIFAVATVCVTIWYTMSLSTIGALRNAPRSRVSTLTTAPAKIVIDILLTALSTGLSNAVPAHAHTIVLAAHVFYIINDVSHYIKRRSMAMLLHGIMLLSSSATATCVALFVYEQRRENAAVTTAWPCVIFVLALAGCALGGRWHVRSTKAAEGKGDEKNEKPHFRSVLSDTPGAHPVEAGTRTHRWPTYVMRGTGGRGSVPPGRPTVVSWQPRREAESSV